MTQQIEQVSSQSEQSNQIETPSATIAIQASVTTPQQPVRGKIAIDSPDFDKSASLNFSRAESFGRSWYYAEAFVYDDYEVPATTDRPARTERRRYHEVYLVPPSSGFTPETHIRPGNKTRRTYEMNLWLCDVHGFKRTYVALVTPNQILTLGDHEWRDGPAELDLTVHLRRGRLEAGFGPFRFIPSRGWEDAVAQEVGKPRKYRIFGNALTMYLQVPADNPVAEVINDKISREDRDTLSGLFIEAVTSINPSGRQETQRTFIYSLLSRVSLGMRLEGKPAGRITPFSGPDLLAKVAEFGMAKLALQRMLSRFEADDPDLPRQQELAKASLKAFIAACEQADLVAYGMDNDMFSPATIAAFCKLYTRETRIPLNPPQPKEGPASPPAATAPARQENAVHERVPGLATIGQIHQAKSRK